MNDPSPVAGPIDERIISGYAYVVTAMAMAFVPILAIMFALPTLLLMGWPTYEWWKTRRDRTLIKIASPIMMLVVATLWTLIMIVAVMPNPPTTWIFSALFVPWIVALVRFPAIAGPRSRDASATGVEVLSRALEPRRP